MKINTTTGFNALAVLIPAIAIIQDMQEGTAKTVLLGLVLVATAIACFITRGYSPVDESDSIETVLKKGRED